MPDASRAAPGRDLASGPGSRKRTDLAAATLPRVRGRPILRPMSSLLAPLSDISGPVEPAGLRDKRAIIDRGLLQEQIAAVWLRASSPDRARSEILYLLKEALHEGRMEVRRRFEAGASGVATMQGLSFLTDQVLRLVYDHADKDLFPLHNPSMGERLSMVAVGGYGRGQLAPFSDIDLLFLLPYKSTPRNEQVVETVLYFLWDLGFKVGHATRSVDDCIRQSKADFTIATNLLEARFLWGDQALYVDLRERYRKDVQTGREAAFIEAKLAERDRRHSRHGEGSRYMLEPNIKEGKGGLRDLQTLAWIGRFVYRAEKPADLVARGVLTRSEVGRLEKAGGFFATLRCHLHFIAGRPEERLTFDLQHQIAPLMGYHSRAGTRAVERFMKHYFLMAKEVGVLTRIFCAQVENAFARRSRFRLPSLSTRRSPPGYRIEGDRLAVKDPGIFTEKPVEMLRIFLIAHNEDLDIHPSALSALTRSLKAIDGALRDDPRANAVFLDILTSAKNPANILRQMNEAGVFGRFLPDFGRVVSLMQFNMYHHFTVDEHTIRAIGILHDIEDGRLVQDAPIASEIVHKVLSRRVLYLAVLLHDIAKGRPGDHSEIGAEIAKSVGPRLGFTTEETETVSWLVLHHLRMSDVAFKRDIADVETIRDFARLVRSVERLRLLLVLTVADIRAVGPGVWTAWKASLLRGLFYRTEEMLLGGLQSEGRERRVDAAKQALAEALAGWPADEIEGHLARGYPAYWLAWDTEAHVRHARLIREAEAERRDLTVDTRVDQARGVTEVTIYTPDHPGLFSRIAGAFAIAGASVEEARIFTLANGMALDVFFVQEDGGGAFDKPGKLAKLSVLIEQTLAGDLKPLQELKKRGTGIPSRMEVFTVAPRVLIDNRASQRHTVVEVNARDRPGLLYRVTFAIARHGLIIDSAKITTFGEQAVDVFYLHDALGSKIEDEQKLRRLRRTLLDALEGPLCPPGKGDKPRKAPRTLPRAQKEPVAGE